MVKQFCNFLFFIIQVISTFVLFYLLVHSTVIAVSNGEADSEADLSAENNFLRFKKEINHATINAT